MNEGDSPLIRNRKEVCAPYRPPLRITRGGHPARISCTIRSGILHMHVEVRDSLERLREVAKQRRNAPIWPRVRAIILAKQGDSAARIARSLGRSRRAVQAWIAAYNGGVSRRWRIAHAPDVRRFCRGTRRADSSSGSMPRRDPRMRSVRCAGPTSAASWSRNSPHPTASAASTSCSIASTTTT
jgi:Homeodomain-like domain-containing protein